MLPERELVELAGIDFCVQHQLLPVAATDELVTVAVVPPSDPAALHELRARLGRPVEVRATSRAQLRVALGDAAGAATGADWRRGLADVLVALRLLRSAHAEAYALAADDEPYLGAELVATGLLAPEELREAVALAFWLPAVSLTPRPPTPQLEALLPPGLAAELRLLPLWVAGATLFAACDSPPPAARVAALHTATGYAVQPVLVAPEELAAALRAVPAEGQGAPVAIERALAALLGPSAFEATRRMAAQAREPLETAARRLHGTTAAELAAALAREAGAATYEPARHGAPVPAWPRALCARLQAVPVGAAGRVAMAAPSDARALRGLAALTGQRVQPLFAPPEVIDGLIEALPADGDAFPGSLVDRPDALLALLRAAALAPADVLAAAEHQRGTTAERVQLTWSQLGDADRADALALATGAPRLQRLLLHPQPGAVMLDADAPGGPGEAAAVQPLAMLREGALLSVAASDLDGAAAAREAVAARGQHAAIAWTGALDLARAAADLAGVDLAAWSSLHVGLARVLEQQRGLLRARVLALFARAQQQREPLDVVAAELHLLRPLELADAFAAVLGARTIDLARPEGAVAGARGADPVDATVARLLRNAECERLGALPFARVAGELVVAMADPLDAATRAELRGLLGSDFSIRPATRSAIREAALRAHGQPALGDLLLDAGLVTRPQLERALALAERSGVRLGAALVSLGVVSSDELAEHVARQQQLPFVAIRGMDLDRTVATLLPEAFARAHGMLPVALDEAGTVTLAVEDPMQGAAIAEAVRLIERPVALAITTRDDVRDGLERLYHERYLQHSAEDLLARFPGDSAYQVLSRGQRWFLSLFAVALVAGLVLWTVPVLIVLLALSTAFYLAFSGYKFYLIYRALSHTLEVPVTAEAVAALRDRDLPVYTLLIPLYRESAVLPLLVRGLSRLDYPKEKLDVKLLLEEDDVETIAAARAASLPPYFDITIVPDGRPKGKPKACNYGLLHARGDFVVIFDAEDIPEPDQLKKVLVAFAISAPEVVCIQTKLNYYNRNQNVLTKWFTTEYSTWFDLFLPGLDASGAPIRLGGTSNHFKTEALRAAGAWDPFNVTEDADLGLRIFKLGGRTAVVDSTTFEEANSVLDNWIRQRSRWVKGYIQTYLVHMRHPLLLLRQLGFGGFMSFQLVIGGTFFGFLLNPVLWALTAVWFATHWSVIQQVFPGPVYYMGAVSLYAGNFAFAYMNVAGCLRRRYYSLVKWALLSPVYWVLMSIAAWKGFLQLFYRPFYWEKTIHGLTDVSKIDELVELTGAPR
jgi:cellulose synthase/poly-beta-1,6-N-acetylglucosamine synthase-like glycosyltransferase